MSPLGLEPGLRRCFIVEAEAATRKTIDEMTFCYSKNRI